MTKRFDANDVPWKFSRIERGSPHDRRLGLLNVGRSMVENEIVEKAERLRAGARLTSGRGLRANPDPRPHVQLTLR